MFFALATHSRICKGYALFKEIQTPFPHSPIYWLLPNHLPKPLTSIQHRCGSKIYYGFQRDEEHFHFFVAHPVCGQIGNGVLSETLIYWQKPFEAKFEVWTLYIWCPKFSLSFSQCFLKKSTHTVRVIIIIMRVMIIICAIAYWFLSTETKLAAIQKKVWLMELFSVNLICKVQVSIQNGCLPFCHLLNIGWDCQIENNVGNIYNYWPI